MLKNGNRALNDKWLRKYTTMTKKVNGTSKENERVLNIYAEKFNIFSGNLK